MEGDRDNNRSTTGYVFTVGGTAVSWISRLQRVVALSSAEAEYVSLTEASKEMIWLQGFMEELERSRRVAGCIVTARVPFILQRTWPSIRRLNMYSSGIISYSLF